MIKTDARAFALAAALLAAGPAVAHSLEDVERQLDAKEVYVEFNQRPAPAFALEDADGRPVTLGDLRGKVIVLHFIFASCTDVCPLHAEKIGRVQSMVNATPMRDQVRFVTITTDPVRDTPEVLRAYGPAHGLDPVNWSFLTSGPERPEATLDLATAFGHKFVATEDGQQMHGVVTHVIDHDGQRRADYHGLKFEPTNLVLYLNALANDMHGPAEARELSLWDRLKALFQLGRTP